MHLVALDIAFQTTCLNFSFAMGWNPSKFDETKGLAFFLKNEPFWHNL